MMINSVPGGCAEVGRPPVQIDLAVRVRLLNVCWMVAKLRKAAITKGLAVGSVLRVMYVERHRSKGCYIRPVATQLDRVPGEVVSVKHYSGKPRFKRNN
jgi:hypothetical protein